MSVSDSERLQVGHASRFTHRVTATLQTLTRMNSKTETKIFAALFSSAAPEDATLIINSKNAAFVAIPTAVYSRLQPAALEVERHTT